jgi:hypothetical protein
LLASATIKALFVCGGEERVWLLKKFRGLDTIQLAAKVVEEVKAFGARTVFVDGVGVCGGVVDRLKHMGYGEKIIEVNAGSRPNDDARYFNKRAEMWGEMRDPLIVGIDGGWHECPKELEA